MTTTTTTTGPESGSVGGNITASATMMGVPEEEVVVRCYNCDEEGHLSRDCKKPRACFLCGETTHVAKQCQYSAVREEGAHSTGERVSISGDDSNTEEASVAVENAANGTAVATKKNVCLNCNETGHRLKSCPYGRKCFQCGQTGHVARECPMAAILRQNRVAATTNNAEMNSANITIPGLSHQDSSTIDPVAMIDDVPSRGHDLNATIVIPTRSEQLSSSRVQDIQRAFSPVISGTDTSPISFFPTSLTPPPTSSNDFDRRHHQEQFEQQGDQHRFKSLLSFASANPAFRYGSPPMNSAFGMLATASDHEDDLSNDEVDLANVVSQMVMDLDLS